MQLALIAKLYDFGVPHNIYPIPLPDGTYYPDYLANKDPRPLEFLAQYNRIRTKPWEECTFSDMGCSEGSTSFRLAQMGATVYGVEGRSDGIARAKILKEILGFATCHFSVGNVNDAASFTEVDANFNAGVLYHLDDPITYLERSAASAREMIYVDTGHRPRSRAEQEGSKFSKAFGRMYTIGYKGLQLEVCDFAEPKDTEEKNQKTGMRRKPRSGIGNTNSVWLSHASLIVVMRELGFPHHQVVSDRPIIPRLRTAFFREEPRPAAAIGAYSHPVPEEIDQLSAIHNTRARDIAYLRASGTPVIVAGHDPLLTATAKDVEAEGIEVSEVITILAGENGQVALGHVQKAFEGKSGHLVLATANPHDVTFRVMLLDRFDYIFNSFAMVQNLTHKIDAVPPAVKRKGVLGQGAVYLKQALRR